jgi:hypothetical protein
MFVLFGAGRRRSAARDEGSRAAADDDEFEGLEPVHRLADGQAADAEDLRQFPFGGESGPRLDRRAGRDQVFDPAGDLLGQRLVGQRPVVPRRVEARPGPERRFSAPHPPISIVCL